jgi:hypothetical protein
LYYGRYAEFSQNRLAKVRKYAVGYVVPSETRDSIPMKRLFALLGETKSSFEKAIVQEQE